VNGERNRHFCGRSSKKRRGKRLYGCENPNIDAIFGKKDIGEYDSDDAPSYDCDKPGSLK
jgi:hypothetical protein